MENGGLTASDVALLNGHNYGYGGDMWGGNSMMWIFALLILAGGGFGGFGGWGNNGFANAIGYENLATQSQVDRGFDAQNSMANQREILSAVTAGTAQSVAATNQTFHDTLAVLNDKYGELQRDIAGLAVGQANALANQNQCCCDVKMEIAQNRYEAAMNTATINANTTAQTQRILDAISQNEIQSLRDQVSALQLAQATNSVVRYPTSTVYSSGCNPFCGCGCNGTM